MKFGIIVFSRFDSQRLPGKALIDLAGRPLLGRVLDRVRLLSDIAEITVATSDQVQDQPIVDYCKSEGVLTFRGHLHDVAQRALDCAVHFGFTHFARVCGDRPFLDPGLISEYWDRMIALDADLVSNSPCRSFPPGLTTEIVRTEALENSLSCTDDSSDREHVTRYFYAHRDRFNIVEMGTSIDWKDVFLAIDTQKDVERACYIFDRIGAHPEEAPLSEIAQFARQWETLKRS